MPHLVAAAIAARLASGSCQRLSRSVPSISRAISLTLIRLLYRGLSAGSGDLWVSISWLAMTGPPTPVFSQVFILKGFKSCVLEVRIPKGLRAGFAEVRIVKDLVTGKRGLWTGEKGRGSRQG